MRCDKCRDDAIFFQSYSGRRLCGRHLALDIESRAKRSIRSHRWIKPGDHIAVVVSGDKKSAALLCFLQKLTADRRDIRLSAIPTKDVVAKRDRRSAAMKIAELLRVSCVEMPEPGGSVTAPSDMVTTIALAISLDDIAQGVLGEFLFGDAVRLVHPPPSVSCQIPVIYPFMTVPSDEIDLYWDNQGTGISPAPGTSLREIIPREKLSLLEDYCLRHPATKYALLHLAEQLSGGNAAATVVAGANVPDCKKKTPSPQKRPNS
jgi:tRNA(Ile)-lysidine synthase TilS/MesJ